MLQELDVKDNPDFQVFQDMLGCIRHSRGLQLYAMCNWCCTHTPQEKLQRRISNAPIKILNPPRPGKKCLVLDIDYTIFDLNSTAGTVLNHCCNVAGNAKLHPEGLFSGKHDTAVLWQRGQRS